MNHRTSLLAGLLVLAAPVWTGCDEGSTPARPDAVVDATADVPVRSRTLEARVDAEGPFHVGYRTWEHTYTPPGTDEPRTIRLHVWYPTEATTGDHPTYYAFFEDEDALLNAPAAPPLDATYPVHVHSHGHQGFGGTSSFLMRRFASHGWVAIAPDHTGDLLFDDDLAKTANTVRHYIERPSDISAALDALDALPANDPLAAVDVSRVVMSGHSRGCYTVWANAGASFDPSAGNLDEATESELDVFAQGFRDPRVVAAIPMAGTYSADWFGTDGYRQVLIPMLSLTGTEDNASAARFRYDTLTDAPLAWIELAGGCHQTFALGYCDTLDFELGFSIVDTYALAFARVHVLGDTDPRSLGILAGLFEVSPLATVHLPR
ncbi:MAG: hypothetical protein H6744_16815 [Deltaproteobacteria bacterium]|nr:hypothetical protein [Deltaproteobacteria bacterium]MCB9788344.1 hypothetical protein [Deltaproteobacteria bacterium]